MTAAWGKKLWDHRKNLGISRKRFAEMLDINEGTLRSYETEARSPGYQTFQKIEKFLDESSKTTKGDEYMNELLHTKDKLIQSLEREKALLERLSNSPVESSPSYGPVVADIIFDFDIEFNWSIKNPGVKVRYNDDTGKYVPLMSKKLGYTEKEISDLLMIDSMVNYSEHRIHELRSQEDKKKMLNLIKSYLTAFDKVKMNTTMLICEIPVSYTAKNGVVHYSMVEYRVNWLKGNGSAHIRRTNS